MKHLLLPLLALFLCLNGILLLESALAQDRSTNTRQTAKRQSEDEVKRAIQAQIDASIAAMKKRDLQARMNGLAPDFKGKLLTGEIIDRQQLEESFKQQHKTIISVSDETRTLVDSVKVNGDEATVFTSQRFVRTVPGEGGKPVEVRTSVTHKEIWTNSDKGWVVKWIEELEQGPTIVDGKPVFQDRAGWAFSKIVWEQGIQKARQVFEEAKRRDPNAVLFQEATLNSLGYRFLQKQRVPEAIEIFKLNTEAYPQAFNTYDSLAEAYMINGEKELAIRYYKKSLKLNLNNKNAVQMLEKLGSK